MTELAAWLVGLPAGLPHWLLFSLISLALTVEAGLLVGLAVPGTTLALAAGAIAQVTTAPLAAAVIATAVGAIAGGQLGYGRGHRRRGHPAPIHGTGRWGADMWPRLRVGLGRHPARVVATGQWLSFGRVLVPRAAGWAGSPYRRFAGVQALSAIAWATALTTIGHTATTAARSNVSLVLAAAAVVTVVLVCCAALAQSRTGHRPATTARV